MRSLAALAVVCTVALAACGDAGPGAPDRSAAPPADGCRDVRAPAARADGGARRATEPLAAGRDWTATVRTSCGDFTIGLDVQGSPRTTASFAGLARQGFYDDTIFHRIVPGFVIQGGDPTQDGGGGPGYTVRERPAASTAYTKGTVAMAKTGAEPAGSSGSQFFVVTGDQVQLPADYAVLGVVTGGFDTVERIGELGGADERPTRPVVVDTVTVAGA